MNPLRRTGRTTRLAAAATLAFALVSVWGGDTGWAEPTGAGTPAGTTADKVVVWSNRHGKVLTAAPGVRNKASVKADKLAAVATPRSAVIGPDGYPDRNRWLYPVGRDTISPVDGSDGQAEVIGASHVEMPFLEYYAMFKQNSSQVSWLGGTPFNADSIEHTDHFRVDYLGTGYTIAGAPTGSQQQANATTAEITWTTTVHDNWYSEHQWDFLAFFPETPPQYGQIFRMERSVTGTFQFGSTYFTVTGQNRTFT